MLGRGLVALAAGRPGLVGPVVAAAASGLPVAAEVAGSGGLAAPVGHVAVAPPALPPALAPQARGTVAAIAGNVAQDFEPPRPSMVHMANVVGAWSSAARIVRRDAHGRAVDLLYVIAAAGGHGDTGWDGVLVWRASTRRIEQHIAPSRADPTPHDAWDPASGEEADGRPVSQHTYQHVIGLDSDHPLGPGVLQLNGYAVGRAARHVGQAHLLRFDERRWVRYGDNTGNDAVYGVHATLLDTRRRRFVRIPSSNYGDWFWASDRGDPATVRWKRERQRDRPAWSSAQPATAVYDPVRDLYLCGSHAHAMHAVRPDEMATRAFAPLTFVGDPLPSADPFAASGAIGSLMSAGWQYVAARDEFVVLDTSTQPPRAVFVIRPPPPGRDPLAAPWVVARRVFQGTSRFAPRTRDRTTFNRALYFDAIDSLLMLPSHDAPMERWAL